MTAILDLGAETNILLPRFMTDPKSKTDVVDSVNFGTTVQYNVEMTVDENQWMMNWLDRMTVPGMPPVAMLLGAPLLSKYDLLFDGPAQRMRMYAPPPRSASGQSPMWFPPGITPADCMPLVQPPDDDGTFKGFVFMPIQINGHPLASYFDSGARGSGLSTRAAQQVGITGDDPHITVRVGRQTIGDLPVNVFPLTGGRDSLQLAFGLDAFRDHILFVSYTTSQVCVGAGARSLDARAQRAQGSQ